MIDIGMLSVDGAIFHYVPGGPNGQGSDGELVAATRESDLDPRLELFLRDRLTTTLDKAAQPICAEDDASPVPDIVKQALRQSTPDIVSPFRLLPDLLLDVQAANSPHGLLSVVRGKAGKARVLGLLKVEQERGISFDTQIEGDDVTVKVVLEDGLVLTSKTELFKAGLFFIEDGELRGLVSDDQTGTIYSGPSSQYWLHDFLGCGYARSSDVQTRAWIKGINAAVRDLDDPADKDNLLSALNAELASNRRQIDPNGFIDDYIPVDKQDAARDRLRHAGAPTTRFLKSRDVAEASPPSRRIRFDTGVEVKVPFGLSVDIEHETADGETVDVLTVRGRIRSVG